MKEKIRAIRGFRVQGVREEYLVVRETGEAWEYFLGVVKEAPGMVVEYEERSGRRLPSINHKGLGRPDIINSITYSPRGRPRFGFGFSKGHKRFYRTSTPKKIVGICGKLFAEFLMRQESKKRQKLDSLKWLNGNLDSPRDRQQAPVSDLEQELGKSLRISIERCDMGEVVDFRVNSGNEEYLVAGLSGRNWINGLRLAKFAPHLVVNFEKKFSRPRTAVNYRGLGAPDKLYSIQFSTNGLPGLVVRFPSMKQRTVRPANIPGLASRLLAEYYIRKEIRNRKLPIKKVGRSGMKKRRAQGGQQRPAVPRDKNNHIPTPGKMPMIKLVRCDEGAAGVQRPSRQETNLVAAEDIGCFDETLQAGNLTGQCDNGLAPIVTLAHQGHEAGQVVSNDENRCQPEEENLEASNENNGQDEDTEEGAEVPELAASDSEQSEFEIEPPTPTLSGAIQKCQFLTEHIPVSEHRPLDTLLNEIHPNGLDQPVFGDEDSDPESGQVQTARESEALEQTRESRTRPSTTTPTTKKDKARLEKGARARKMKAAALLDKHGSDFLREQGAVGYYCKCGRYSPTKTDFMYHLNLIKQKADAILRPEPMSKDAEIATLKKQMEEVSFNLKVMRTKIYVSLQNGHWDQEFDETQVVHHNEMW